MVSPGDGGDVVAFDGARVVVPAGAVSDPVAIGVSDLIGSEVPVLDSGMTNVTGSPRAGFRFTPHPMTFGADLELTLPFDPSLLSTGFTAQDVYTYFYDDVALCWRPLERASVDAIQHTVTSLSNHFTDFINATVSVPDSPENVSFDPNQMKGISAADPGAGITVLGVPGANSQGTNVLSYPVAVPAGRSGMQPGLAISYDSAAGDGWLGLGWDLGLPQVTIDTRFGVPRYDGAKETESYLLNGQQLTPLAGRGAPVARSAADKVFHTRVEGDFARIVRHGTTPSTYTWEVTDKAGTHFFYGALAGASGPDAGQTLSGGDANGSGVFVWPLREVRDTHGNFMRFTYVKQPDPGVAGGQDGFNLYPQTITYTGSGSDAGRYVVSFVRDRNLGEPLRTDKEIDARGGFKRVTADLLRRIDVSFVDNPAAGHQQLVRRYVLSYTTGAFGKTLLASIGQTDDAGVVVGTHTFGYFDDVRNGGSYQGFGTGTAWSVPGDSLANSTMNALLTGSGGASVINANSTTTVGGHLFIGAGTGSPVSKSGKIGLAFGASGSTDEGLIALVDVDGDGLPDKVFRTGSVLDHPQFWYRKNLSRPGGQLAFSDVKKQLNLPSIGHGGSTSFVWGIEGYAGSAAAQLDRVHVSSTTSRYFADVNDDGVTDLVDGSGVWFGRLGADGTPVYGLDDSSATAAPVTSRPVDTAVLGNLGPAPSQLVDANPPADVVRRWIAPFDGHIGINAAVRLAAATRDARAASRTADGVRVAIQLNGSELGSVDIAPTDNGTHFVVPSTQSITVHKGDRLYFRVGAKNDGSLDQVDWDPLVTYLNIDTQNTVDENGLPTLQFHQAADFTLGGRSTQAVAPLTGTIHLSGAVIKAHPTTDDVTVVVTRDGTPVLSQTIPATTSGSTPINTDVAVTQGQVLKWRLAIDSPIDLGSLSWVPRADYTTAEGVDHVTDPDGNPLISLFPPYDVDMYPDDGGLTGPRDPFVTGTESGTYSVQPDLAFAPPADPKDPRPSGQVVFTVKRRGQLLGKRVIQVTNGAVASVSPIVVPEHFDPPNPGQDPTPDELYFDYSTRDPGLRSVKPDPVVHVTFDAAPPNDDTFTTDTDGVFRTPLVEGGFPQSYRGWGAIAYNGGGSRETDPITEGDLVVDQDYADQLPDSVDPQGQQGDFNNDPHVNVPTAFALAPSPKNGQWSTGKDLWAAAGGASTSRLSADSVGLPSGADFAGGIAVSRVADSDQTSLTGSVSIAGGSAASGDTVGQVDFLDLNGDGFPDVVSGGGIQYSDPDGGLGARRGTLPDGAVRSSSTDAANVGINVGTGSAGNSGSPAETVPDGTGLAAPTGTHSANAAHGGNVQGTFGGDAHIGHSDSDSKFDLIDVNGDGLPDRVYADGGVRLNLGYSFETSKETWPSPTPTNPSGAPLNDGDGTTTNAGLNLGFNTDSYSFAGGVSFSVDHNGTRATLADVNGDGLPDRVFNGNPVMVGFNTGNGFAAPVAFGSLSEQDSDGSRIGSDQNGSLGGGVYATFGFCIPLVDVCIVFNPGADASTGVSRSVQALRDVNGDGYADAVVSTDDDQLTVAANTTGRTNLLKTVTLPLGAASTHASMSFDYTRDGNTAQMPQSRFVLSRVSVDDNRPGDGADVQAATFAYSGGAYDRAERQFDGYATVVTRQVDPAHNDTVLRTATSSFRTDGPYTHGLLTKSVTADAAGHTFVETDNTYTLHDVDTNTDNADPHSPSATIFAELTRTDTKWFEGQDTPGKTTFGTTRYDAVGNVIESFDAGEPGSGDDVDVTISYTATEPGCQSIGVTGVADRIDVTGGGVVMRHRESTVDCMTGGTTGDITQVRAKLAGGGGTATTDLEYFANGNLKKVTGPTNLNGLRYFESYGYDTTVGSYVESITDAFGLHSSTTHDFRFGTVLTSTDENNQRVTNAYDNLGRLATVTSPYEQGTGHATIAFEYHPDATVPYARTSHIDKQADGTYRGDTIDTIAFTDGLDRVIETKVDAAVSTGPGGAPADVMIVSGRQDRDALGRAVKAFFPITEPKGPANTTLNPAFTAAAFDSVTPTVTSYDGLDRPTKITLPDGTFSTTSYGFGTDRAGNTQFETVATDANGKSTRSYLDVRGQTTALKQFNPSGGSGQAVIWTSYGYDPLGQKTSITDNANNTTSMVYDNLGRQTSVTDPDSGETDYVYDLAGDLIKKHVAKLAANQFVGYDYDFTRLKNINYPLFTGNDVTYTYGAPGAADNGAGRVVSVTDAAGTQTSKYGPLGEVVSQTLNTTSSDHKPISFTTGYQFDAFNRVLNLTYPDGEVLSYHYNSGGQVDQASGVKDGNTYTYLSRLDYDKFGQRVLLDAGNGVRTQYNYDSTTRRLANLKSNLAANVAGGYVFQNLNYTYDNVGNITAISNDTTPPPGPAAGAKVGGPSSQSFTYDDLYRLTHAQGTYTPSTGHPDTYTQDLTYDAISNITNKTENHTVNNHTDKDLTYDNDYTYHGATPHAADTIGVYTFQYDADGNQVSRSQQSGPRQQLIWDEDNRLACAHENVQSQTLPQDPSSCDSAGGTPDASFLYDDQGNRIVKNSAQLHIYPNQNFSTIDKKEYKHIYIGGTRLLTKQVEDNKFENQQFYTQPDNIGSTDFVTDGSGQLASHMDYLPGGETWVNERPTQPVPIQYAGKELDPETGLYYYGARYYNPQFQQFQSTDPALPGGAADSIGLSTYLYARANPITYTDPDGRKPVPGTAIVRYNSSGSTSIQISTDSGGVSYSRVENVRGKAEVWPGPGDVIQSKYKAIEVDLPDAGAAQRLQETLINQRDAGAFEPGVNDQATHIEDLLKAGGNSEAAEGFRDIAGIPRAPKGLPVEPEGEEFNGGWGVTGSRGFGFLQLMIEIDRDRIIKWNEARVTNNYNANLDLANLGVDLDHIANGQEPTAVTHWEPYRSTGFWRLQWNDSKNASRYYDNWNNAIDLYRDWDGHVARWADINKLHAHPPYSMPGDPGFVSPKP